jgi:galactokinase
VHESSPPSPWPSSPDGPAYAAFHRLYGTAPDVCEGAPGRVPLVGEQTDAHGGCLLTAVLPHGTVVTLRRREDRTVRACSVALGGEADVFTIGTEQPGRGWLDYVQGTTCVLREHGVLPPGLDVRIDSRLPIGAGVSASAALVVGLFRALRRLCTLPLDDLEIARLAARVETHFVGAPAGIVDHMACSLGRRGQALFVDTRHLRYEYVPWPAAAELIVIDAGIDDGHAGGPLARRRESLQAAAALGVHHLRDVGADALGAVETLPEPLRRRARHVVGENQRVLDAAAALRAGEPQTVGRLLAASHASLRDDFEIGSPALDALVALGQADPAVFGARMTGGGLGGAAVMIARAGEGRAAAERIARAYQAQAVRPAAILSPAAARRAAGR